LSQREASICSIHAKDLEGNLLVLLPRPNPLKSKIDDRQQVFGVWCSTASPIVAEILGQSDFDFVIFDAEHAPNDISSLLSQLHSFQRARPEPILRVPHNDIATFKRMSDLGFRSFLVPFVQNEEEARRAVAGVLYPPDGMRGLAPTRSASFGDDVRYVAEANSNVQLILQHCGTQRKSSLSRELMAFSWGLVTWPPIWVESDTDWDTLLSATRCRISQS